MRDINLDRSGATELAELLGFLADWISGAHRQTIADSLAAFVGQADYHLDELAGGLQRFVFLLGLSGREELFGDPTP